MCKSACVSVCVDWRDILDRSKGESVKGDKGAKWRWSEKEREEGREEKKKMKNSKKKQMAVSVGLSASKQASLPSFVLLF